MWREALKDLKRKIKLALFFPSKDSEFIRSLHVPNKEWTPPIELPRQIDNWFHLAFKTIYPIKNRLRFNLSRHQRHLLRHLTTRSDLVVVDSDKNLGPAILTSAQHSRLAFHHLQSNMDSYQKVPTTMAAEVLHRLQRTVESFQRDLVELHPEWRKNSKIIINKIVHTTFVQPCKRDANNNWNGSIRPIVASPGSPTHGLSKWVDHLLRPYLSQYSTILKDSKSILIQLRQMQFSSEDRLFTFDAKSLYTSIPLRQALHVLRDITKADRMFPFISQGLEIVLDSNYFSFGSTIWKQTCGIAMGTPVAPTIANLYLAFYEERFLKSSDLWKSEIRLFQRYIDDLLLVWRPTTKKVPFQLLQGSPPTPARHPMGIRCLQHYMCRFLGPKFRNQRRKNYYENFSKSTESVLVRTVSVCTRPTHLKGPSARPVAEVPRTTLRKVGFQELGLETVSTTTR